MDFTTFLSVKIGERIIKTVHSVRTKYDSKHIGSVCDIVVPLNSQIDYLDGTHDFLTGYVLSEFKVGDAVLIQASYPNTGLPLVTVFRGFLYEFKEGMPCTLRCIDYLPLLGHMQDLHYASISLKDLVTNVLKGTGISLILPTVDVHFVNITFRSCSPWSVLDYLKKMLGLNISLTGDRLYCNVASNTVNTVIYRSDRNLYACDLQQPDTVWQGYKVKAFFVKPNGVRDSLEIGDKDGHLVNVYFYNVTGGTSVYSRLASEALVKVRQRKFSGKVRGYLYPDAQLFDKIQYTDVRYPDRSGSFVLTELVHDISDQGFHREMTWAFLTDFLNTPNATA